MGAQVKVDVAPGAKKSRLAIVLGRGVRLQFSLCAPIVPRRDATFLQMTRLLQITSKNFIMEA